MSAAPVTCGNCGRSWCEARDPAPAALCHWCHGRGYSTAPLAGDSAIDELAEHYAEAVIFTDTGDIDQPTADAELSEAFVMRARADAAAFLFLVSQYPELVALLDDDDLTPGFDLWFSSQGHGTGFWDKTDQYGEHADELDRLAKIAVSCDRHIWLNDDGDLELE